MIHHTSMKPTGRFRERSRKGPRSGMMHHTSRKPDSSSSAPGKEERRWQSSSVFSWIVAALMVDTSSGTYFSGSSRHHHGQPISSVFGTSGPRPAHWMAPRRFLEGS